MAAHSITVRRSALGFAESLVGLVGRLALAAALVFVGFIIKDVYDWLSHSHSISTPARGAAAVVTKSYTVETVIPCGSLALVGAVVHVSVSDSALFGLFGAHVNATYPERIDVCVGGGLPVKATVGRSSVLVAAPVLHPVSLGIDDWSQKGGGGVGTAWYQSASTGEINAVEKDSRSVADVSTALTPLPVKKQTTIIKAAEKLALPELRHEFGTKTVTFRKTATVSAFDQVVANWHTFGPEIRSAFPSLRFGKNGLTLTAKDGTGGTASIGLTPTSKQLAELNKQ